MSQDLSDFETRMLAMIGADWTQLRDLASDTRLAVDYLVLSGLVERAQDDAQTWLNEWRLTGPGIVRSLETSAPALDIPLTRKTLT